MRLNRSGACAQRGMTLLESLIAILVSAIGILGILGVQLRTLSDTTTSVRRAQAVRLMEDLSERLKANPNALVNMAHYLTGWEDTPASPTDCARTPCSNAELAQYDRAEWKLAVKTLLPLGNATVFLSAEESDTDNRRQLGVMISWRESEAQSSDADYISRIDTGKTSSGVACESGRTCHLQYIPVSGRCSPYFANQQVQYYCTGL